VRRVQDVDVDGHVDGRSPTRARSPSAISSTPRREAAASAASR
jgi:hypothetical protein